jgi:hypothetical protein
MSADSDSDECAMSEDDGPDPDPVFTCPITLRRFKKPVVATDGFSYERRAIRKWLRSCLRSPMTNSPLPRGRLVANHNLRQAMQRAAGRCGEAA